MTALTGQQIVTLGIMERPAPKAVQPNGCDLSAAEIERIVGYGGVYPSDKHLPETEPVAREWRAGYGCRVWVLAPGAYLVRMAETVRFPADTMGYIRPRSTLIRCGAALHTGVVDAGYHGRLQCLLVVTNPEYAEIGMGARVAQLTVHRLDRAAQEGYHGSYQGEGLSGTPYSVCPACGEPSDLEGNAVCAKCDWPELNGASRPQSLPAGQENLISRGGGVPRVNPRLIAETSKGLIPSPRLRWWKRP